MSIRLNFLFLLILSVKSYGTMIKSSQTQYLYNNEQINQIIESIFHFSKPSRLSIFIPGREFYNSDRVLKCISNRTTAFLVNTDKVKSNSSYFNRKAFFYPRSYNFYVIIYQSDNFEKLYGILDLMVRIAPRPTRPRCLLILTSANNISQENIENISLYAWSKKFLDFTILSSFQGIVNYTLYDPFLNKYSKGSYKPGINLFPDKSRNFHGYKMIIAATNNPPFVLLERNDTGYPILNHTGANHRALRILAKVLNFTYHLAPSNTEYYSDDHEDSLFNKMLTGEINLSMNHLFISRTNTHFHQLERSIITITEEYTAMIPVALDKKVKTSRDFVIYTISGVLTFLFFYLLMKLLRFNRYYWSASKLLQIFLNVSVFHQPRKWSERFVFFSASFMAMNVTINILTELTQIQFEPYDDVTSNDLKVLGRKGFTPVILEQFLDVSLENDIEDDAEFKKRVQILKSADECAVRLEEGEKIVCFMTRYVGEAVIRKYMERNEEPAMKLIKPYLWQSWKTIAFEPGTPFVEGFDRILRRLRDSGLLERFVYDVTHHVKIVNVTPSEEEILNKKITSVGQLGVQLLIGYAVASIVFVGEVLIFKTKKRKIRRNRG